METTGGDAYWLNDKNERHNISIHNMARESLLIIIIMKTNGDLQHKYQKKFINIKYTVLWETSHLTLHGTVKKPSIHELRKCGYDIYPITPSHKKIDNITQEVLFMGYTNSIYIIKWWDSHTKRLKYCLSEKFD